MSNPFSVTADSPMGGMFLDLPDSVAPRMRYYYWSSAREQDCKDIIIDSQKAIKIVANQEVLSKRNPRSIEHQMAENPISQSR